VLRQVYPRRLTGGCPKPRLLAGRRPARAVSGRRPL